LRSKADAFPLAVAGVVELELPVGRGAYGVERADEAAAFDRVCGFHAALIALADNTRKDNVAVPANNVANCGGFYVSRDVSSGQFWTTTDAYLRKNLRVAGIAQW
jgi:hypothetical protein